MRRSLLFALSVVVAFVAGLWLGSAFLASGPAASPPAMADQTIFVDALSSIAEAGFTLRFLHDQRLDELEARELSRLTGGITLADHYLGSFDELEAPIPNLIEAIDRAAEVAAELGKVPDGSLERLRVIREWASLKSEAVELRESL